MKKGFLVLALFAGFAYITFSSNAAGPSGNLTGSNGGTQGCGGTGCHSAAATPGLAINIVLDSAGTIVSRYVPGIAYRVRVTGINATTGVLPKFGFQMAAVSGTGAAAVQAGTFSSLPPGGALTTYSGIYVIGNNTSLSATGTGSTGSLDSFSVVWAAPVAGTGAVKMNAVICAADGNGLETNDIWNAVTATFNEEAPASAVADIKAGMEWVTYPNPVTNSLHLKLNNAGNENYTVNIFDINGRRITPFQLVINGNEVTTINTTNWQSGIYELVLENNGVVAHIALIRQ